MKLKKIYIYGFKSFADQTEIEVKDGITAVIGPNGSGKSNIVDAIRWVLGEQSIKSLRGNKSQDIIFFLYNSSNILEIFFIQQFKYSNKKATNWWLLQSII